MNKVLTSEELKSIQQPLDYQTGYSNDNFDKLYPNAKNPFHGTERDSKNRKNYNIKNNLDCDMCSNIAEYISKKDGIIEYKLCKECYHNKIKENK
jgi:hypothetical protein